MVLAGGVAGKSCIRFVLWVTGGSVIALEPCPRISVLDVLMVLVSILGFGNGMVVRFCFWATARRL